MLFFTFNADDEVQRAKTDERFLNRFIAKNKKFIMACAYRSVNHFVTESDDEWSVALIAFHEAIRTYDSERGDFRKFAGVVIDRRLTDHLRSQLRHAGEISVDAASMDGEGFEEDELSGLQLEVREKEAELSRTQSIGRDPGSSAVKDEIDAMQQILHAYGFSFFELAECSPKAEKTKVCCARAVRTLLQDRILLENMRKTKSLSIKTLSVLSDVPKKVLERHRKYIIAVTEILDGDYPNLAEYLRYIRKGQRTEGGRA